MIDFETLSKNLLSRSEALVHQWLPEGRRSGPEWVAKNPRRDDSKLGSFKINLNTGVWKDWACNDGGGDLISLYAYINQMGQADAARDLGDDWKEIKKIKPLPKEKPKWEATGKPGPREATEHEMQWTDKGKVVQWWSVRNAENQVLYYDVRFEFENKSGEVDKDILPMCWCKHRDEDRHAWRYKAFPSPRPIYNHVAVSKIQGPPVIIVEGMKCAAAMATILGDKFPIVTWQGGSEAIDKADWTPLENRAVIIWPDADLPGIKAAQNITNILEKIGCQVQFIRPHEDAPKGWDVADFIQSGADRKKILSYIKTNRVKPSEIHKKDHKPQDLNDQPFRVLGHDREYYFYLPTAKGQIVALKMGGHTKNNLLSLAPITWWEDKYPTKKGVSWTAAQNDLMREADEKGPFSLSKIRGRGAWRDGKDLLVHVGDRLIVNGKPQDPVKYVGGFIYERGVKLNHQTSKPADNKLGKSVIDLYKLFAWKSDVQAFLAAGWAFLAPICGALYWRPHLWITGEPGSGKTWLRDNAIAPFVRDFGILAQGSTSAAGIRQALRSDALPVLFDEAESNEKKAGERIAEVLELMRQSSMSGESAIIKGSAHGESMAFAPSSMWCLTSVVNAVKHQADQGRISLLEICKYDEKMEHIKKRTLREQHRITADMVGKIFTPQNCHSLTSRAFKRLPIILKNIEVFRDASAEHFGNQRAGDQIGTLLAGAYSLGSNGNVTHKQALQYVSTQNWDDVVREDEQEEDHEQLIRYIFQHVTRVITPADGATDKTLGQLSMIAFEPLSTSSLNQRVAREHLSIFGITVSDKDKRVLVSKKHRQIQKILMGTQWEINYASVLSRIPGAKQTNPRPIEVDGKTTSKRMISLPKDLVDDQMLAQLPVEESETEEDVWQQEGMNF